MRQPVPDPCPVLVGGTFAILTRTGRHRAIHATMSRFVARISGEENCTLSRKEVASRRRSADVSRESPIRGNPLRLRCIPLLYNDEDRPMIKGILKALILAWVAKRVTRGNDAPERRPS